MGMKPYVVKQGEYLSKIAFRMGFDPDEIWGDGANADLKKKRTSGEILAAGDVLYVPDEPKKKLAFTKESENKYKAKLPTKTIKVFLKRTGDKPLKDEPYVVRGVGDKDIEGTTDADGTVKFDAPVTVRLVEIELPKKKRTLKVAIGDLDPVSEKSGAKDRLQHLGFYGATMETSGDGSYASRDDALLMAALKAFQTKQKITPSGLLDDATQAALALAHGS